MAFDCYTVYCCRMDSEQDRLVSMQVDRRKAVDLCNRYNRAARLGATPEAWKRLPVYYFLRERREAGQPTTTPED